MKKTDVLWLAVFFLGVAITTSVVYRNVKSEWVTYRRGQSRYANHNYAGAIQCFERALEAGIAPSAMMEQLAASYRRQGHGDKIQLAFTQYLNNSENPRQLYRLGKGYEAAGKLDLAGLAYRALVEARPWEKNVRIQLARVLTWTDQWEQAVQQYRIALREEE